MLNKLDPVFVDLYNKHVANTPNKPIDLAFLRSKYSVLYSYGTGPAPDVGRTYDTEMKLQDGTTMAMRVYEPSTKGPWPVHLDFHGGGWGLGDLDTEAHICQHICVKANVVVVDVAYRLVPEHPFPTGIEDSFEAIRYVYENHKQFHVTQSISIGGVSAGACIALTCAHWARDAKIPITLVAAGTPTIDDLARYKSASESPFKSMQENEFAPTLNWARLAWFDKLKWQSPETDVKRVGWVKNLLDAPDFTNLPRTLLYTAGADPLRDEAEAYGMKLIEHGNEVVLRRFLAVPHPFQHMDGALKQASEAIDLTCKEIGDAHVRTSSS